MDKKQLVLKRIVPLCMFILSVGLIASCSNKKSNSDEMNDSSTENSMDNDQMNDQMNEAQMMTYSADLSGENEVPAVESDASGNVTVTVNKDGSAHIKGQFSGLSSAYTGSHIHMGAKGKNGDVIHPLDPTMKDNKMAGSWDADVDMNDTQMSALKSGKLYVNVHSKDHKSGEIRGQLTTSDSDMNDSMDN